MKKDICTVVYWGALWGLVEATLGYALHTLPIKVGWFFWFPLAFYFINQVYRRTNNFSSILCTSSIAAGIKLVNIFLPTRIDKVINPAVSILLEGLVVFVAFRLIQNRRESSRLQCLVAMITSVSWRILYMIYILLMPSFFFSISPLRSPGRFSKYLFIESIVNGLVVFVYLILSERISSKKSKEESLKKSQLQGLVLFVKQHAFFRVAFSFSLLALAIYLQWVL